MPTYVYRCTQGHTFELFHAITDDSQKRCPECNSEAKRIPAAGGGLLFKGSGFYATDYRSKGYRDAAKKESGGKEASGGKESSGSGGASGGDKPATGGAGGDGKSKPGGGSASKPDASGA